MVGRVIFGRVGRVMIGKAKLGSVGGRYGSSWLGVGKVMVGRLKGLLFGVYGGLGIGPG